MAREHNRFFVLQSQQLNKVLKHNVPYVYMEVFEPHCTFGLGKEMTHQPFGLKHLK